MKRIFQIIVLGSLALQFIWFLLPYSWSFLYEGEELNLLSWSNYGAYFDVNGLISYVILAAYVTVSIGLVLLKKLARTGFLFLTVGQIISSPAWGFAVSPPLDGSIGYITSMADGAILTIAYLTSLGSQFE